MGLRHLARIEELLKTGKEYTKTELRDITRMNLNTLQDVLSYLLNTKKIKEKNLKGKKVYQWQSANISKNAQKNIRSKKSSVEKHTTSTSKTRKEIFTK